MKMQEFIKKYPEKFITLINSVRITDIKKKKLNISDGIESVCKIIKQQTGIGKKIFFIGNGGSAAIASHMAIDFWKNGKMPAMAFNDSSLLTCISNDFGYKHVFEKPVEMFAGEGDILFAISSSGRSENILNAVRAARSKNCSIITLSGFDNDNPLSFEGDYNFYISSGEYGLVEVAHQYICHFILDTIING